MAEFTGTEDGDLLEGARSDDRITGLGGNDTILSLAGNDTIEAGDGDDSVNAGSGDDVVDAGTGNDTLLGAPGADLLQGRGGNDSIVGGPDNDTLQGGAGDDILNGGDGADLLQGGGGFDRLNGSQGNDSLRGGGRSDLLIGGEGADLLDGEAGIADEVNYVSSTDAVNVVLNFAGSAEVSSGGDAAGDIVVNVENFTGSAGNDTVTIANDPGSSAILRLRGAAGDDRIDGSGAPSAQLVLEGGVGADTLIGNAAGSRLFGQNDDDSLQGGAGDDVARGGAGDDTLIGGGGANDLFGQSDNDLIISSSANDTIRGGAGNDTIRLVGVTSVASVNGGGGEDWLEVTGAASGLDFTLGVSSLIENISATPFNDTITGTRAANVIDGLEGDDSIAGDNGNDVLIGGTGFDQLDGGAGNDLLIGTSVDYLTEQPAIIEELFTTIDRGEEVFVLLARTALWYINTVLGSADYSGLANIETDVVPDTTSGLSGGDGNDTLFASGDATPTPHSVFGGNGNDLLFVFAGNGGAFIGGDGDGPEELAGDDTIVYDGSSVVLDAGAGDDIVRSAFVSESETEPQHLINLGNGNDIYNFELFPGILDGPDYNVALTLGAGRDTINVENDTEDNIVAEYAKVTTVVTDFDVSEDVILTSIDDLTFTETSRGVLINELNIELIDVSVGEVTNVIRDDPLELLNIQSTLYNFALDVIALDL